ncbi:MAG: hypothetical protein EBU88_16905, partial [Acidobacteria bacterium]|nr:hypothetical protein [Acidobacteriota bacterium]
MALVDLWRSAREQLDGKHLQQIIAFAGDGKLRDDGAAAHELRAFLSLVPTDVLRQYAADCLGKSFQDSGLALQEVVNQIGRRLGFSVVDGRYRGVKGHAGFDGLWKRHDHAIVVEVKTTDAYRLDLGTVARYRQMLASEAALTLDQSSILIVVGREDTGDLEAQIRGSRHSWDVRLISVDALEHLMVLKEDLEDPALIRKIHDILLPREFTKLDEIVDLVFSATEDVREPEMPDGELESSDKKFTPVSFHAACIARIESELGKELLKQSRASFATADGETAVLCAVSREYSKARYEGYWFAFHPHQQEFLESAANSYVGLGCG